MSIRSVPFDCVGLLAKTVFRPGCFGPGFARPWFWSGFCAYLKIMWTCIFYRYNADDPFTERYGAACWGWYGLFRHRKTRWSTTAGCWLVYSHTPRHTKTIKRCGGKTGNTQSQCTDQSWTPVSHH